MLVKGAPDDILSQAQWNFVPHAPWLNIRQVHSLTIVQLFIFQFIGDIQILFCFNVLKDSTIKFYLKYNIDYQVLNYSNSGAAKLERSMSFTRQKCCLTFAALLNNVWEGFVWPTHTINPELFHSSWKYSHEYIDRLMQERCNSNALSMELHFSCIDPSTWHINLRFSAANASDQI